MSESRELKDAVEAGQRLQRVAVEVGKAIEGKQAAIRLALCAIVGGGHLLIEDLPGVGKTTLAQALSRALGLDFARVQFTSDLLPSDVIGAQIFDPREASFSFRPGPVFAQVVLADEINRAPPRTQSALLEAMSERQVSVDGVSHPLPRPFIVLATQNPIDQSGTYPLPDSQLDRFLLRLSLGYPPPHVERALVASRDATVSVSVFGDDDLKQTALSHLKHHARDFQALINRQVRLKFTPRLTFRLDLSLEKGDEVLAILDKLPPVTGDGEPGAAPQA